MCGGGGGDANEAIRYQDQLERQRQQQVNGVVTNIRNTFNSQARADEIAKYQADAEKLYRTTLDGQHSQAARELKFAMARTGQGTGQVAVDKGAQMTRQYNEGVLKVSRAAAQAASRLRASDQDTQNSLIAMAQSGMDMTNANQLAMSGMRSNVLNAQGEAAPEALGQAFSGLADTYQFSQEAKAYNRGYESTMGGGTPGWMSAFGNQGPNPNAPAGSSQGQTSMPTWMGAAW